MSCTARRICEGCENEESETVTASYTEEKAGCETNGKKEYKAEFKNPSFEVQTKTIMTDSLGHDVTDAVWSKDEKAHWKDCKNGCGKKLEQAEHTFQTIIDRQATESTEGSSHEECSVCGYQKAAVVIPVTGKEETTNEQPSNTNTLTVGQVVVNKADGSFYTIKKNAGKVHEVEYKAPKNKKQTKIAVPDSIKINGATYKVTSIAKSAFKNNKNLKTIIIPATVRSIGKQAFAGCTHVIERVYHTKANQQAMMETFRAYTHLDVYGRLNVVASTQIPFHTRRILAHALDIPKSRIRVIKPRIGGGFGAKQTVVAEVYPAIVTWKTGKPAKIIYSRYESQIASSPRHEMEVRVKLGCDDNGILKAMDVYTLSNTGAYGEHGPTTVGLSGHKSIPLYHTPEAFRFSYDVVYTNRMSAGAYRGYGATQGIFAVESAVSELAAELGMDPVKFRELNMVKEGDVMPAYYGETADSCALDRCVARVKDMIGWDGKYPRRQVSGSKVRGVGLAMAMQGSSISGVDVAGATIKINDDGFYNLIIGAADMGTGCDTTLAQVAAECLGCELDDIVVFGADTDISPYDSGSYASSTAYLTGTAVVKTCEALKEKILHKAAKYLETGAEELEFDGKRVYKLACEADGTRKEITIKDLANRVQCANEDALQVTQSHSSPISPPPFMAGAAEVEVDLETGQVELIKFAAAVDCGTPLNENLARVQTEGGLVQGIGMALYEDVSYSKDGKVHENSFMQYKVPSRLDVGRVQVEFESSFEPTGPFGAKSIGEVVINTPSPAIANAVYNAVGVRIRELPITAEKVFKGMNGLD